MAESEMKKILIYFILGISFLFSIYLNVTNKDNVIYRDKIIHQSINYKSITDSITNTIVNQVADTSYVFIDSIITKIKYKDSLRIKDSLVFIPYNVVKFNYNDSLIFAKVSTYYNNKGSKYDFKYTIKPSKYSFIANYTSPDTLQINFKHQYFFNKDTIIVMNGINNYIKSKEQKWWDKYWIGTISGALFTAGITFLIK